MLSMKQVTFNTDDAVTIVGDYYPPEKEFAPAVLLLHMMPRDRESWRDFAPILVSRGFQVLAIDERGHGDSVKHKDTVLNFKEFSDTQHQAKILDVKAARHFLIDRGVRPPHIFVGGASIGANLAIQYMARNIDAVAGFALSPGYNYKGIEPLGLMEQLGEGQTVYLAAAKDDAGVPDSSKAVEEFAQAGPAHKKYKIFETGGHGTDMFRAHPEFMDELADWLGMFV